MAPIQSVGGGGQEAVVFTCTPSTKINAQLLLLIMWFIYNLKNNNVPDYRRIQHANIVFCQLKCLHLWLGRVKGMFVWVVQGAEWGCEMGQLILTMGPVRAKVCILRLRTTTPSKRFFLSPYICLSLDVGAVKLLVS